MKLWLSKNSEISLREQLTRQIILAIVSGDLKSNDKLPSVREIALRHKIHANTASAAYRWLEKEGWVLLRVGSGVYVREIPRNQIDETAKMLETDLDKAILAFLLQAKNSGADNQQIKSRLNFWLNRKRSTKKIVVIEPNEYLSHIFAHELGENFDIPVSIANSNKNLPKNSLAVSLADNFEATSFVKIKLNSVQQSLRIEDKPTIDDLVGIASHYETFLRWTQTILAAVGIAEENLVIRNANKIDWLNGLNSCKFIIADSLTAKKLNELKDVRIFRLISDESLEECRTAIN